MYINLTDGEVSFDGVSFTGDAAVVSKDTCMLVNGTKLSLDGTVVIESNKNTTCVVGGGYLSFATEGTEEKIKVFKEYFDIDSKDDISDVFGNSIDHRGGADVIVDEDTVSVSAKAGYYEWKLK